MGALELLMNYTAKHNAGLGGNWETLRDLFEQDAVMTFVGLPQAQLQGLPAILAAFEANPPTEAFLLLEKSEIGCSASARYACESSPSTPAGTLILEADGDKISRLVISGQMPESLAADPVQVVLDLAKSRYPGCEAIFLAGSVVRGEATPASDLDLVVIYGSINRAFRESFIVDGWPVEAFVHDPQTLSYFFWKVDRPSGRPSLPGMVSDGVPLPASTRLTSELQATARRLISAGPDRLDTKALGHLRYAVTDKIDDLRHARNRAEALATAADFYDELANFVLRSRGCWAASGKAIPRALEALDPALAMRFARAFADLFELGRPEAILAVANEVLDPYGGRCFDGYRRDAPPGWRTPTLAPEQAVKA